MGVRTWGSSPGPRLARHLRALQFLGGKGGRWAGRCVGEWIARRLPVRGTYIEPFGGMAGVLLNREPAGTEILNDADGDIVNWWACVREAPERMERLVAASPYAEADFLRARALLAEAAPFDPAAPDLARAAALTRVLMFGVRHSNGRRPTFAIRWRNNPRVIMRADAPTIRALAGRLHGVQLLARDAIEIMARSAKEPNACVYVDPSYANTLDDYGATVDRDRLREALEAQVGACAVSGFGSEWDCLGWRREEFRRTFPGLGTEGGQVQDRTEVLWCNFPPPKRLFG